MVNVAMTRMVWRDWTGGGVDFEMAWENEIIISLKLFMRFGFAEKSRISLGSQSVFFAILHREVLQPFDMS